MMLEKIAKITGLSDNNGNNVHMNYHLRKIAHKLGNLPQDVEESAFVEAVEKAAEEVSVESRSIFGAIITTILDVSAEQSRKSALTPEQLELEHVYKIARSPKGKRIDAPAPDGKHYSFGPIWNASVIKGKGIAVSESNRPKLNHQALLLGINNAEEHAVKELVTLIAAKLLISSTN